MTKTSKQLAAKQMWAQIEGQQQVRSGSIVLVNPQDPNWAKLGLDADIRNLLSRGEDNLGLSIFKDPTSAYQMLKRGVQMPLDNPNHDKVKMPFEASQIGEELDPYTLKVLYGIRTNRASTGTGKRGKREAAGGQEDNPFTVVADKKAPKYADSHNKYLDCQKFDNKFNEAYMKSNQEKKIFFDNADINRMAVIIETAQDYSRLYRLPTAIHSQMNGTDCSAASVGHGTKHSNQIDASLDEHDGMFLSSIPFIGMERCYMWDEYPHKDSYKPSATIREDMFYKWLIKEKLGKTFFAGWTTEVYSFGPKLGQKKHIFVPSLRGIEIPFLYHPESGLIFTLVMDDEQDISITYEHTRGIYKTNLNRGQVSDEFQIKVRNMTLDSQFKLAPGDLKKATLYANIVSDPYNDEGVIKE